MLLLWKLNNEFEQIFYQEPSPKRHTRVTPKKVPQVTQSKVTSHPTYTQVHAPQVQVSQLISQVKNYFES